MPCSPVIVWNWSIYCPSLLAMFSLLHRSTNQELFEMYLCNQGSHNEKILTICIMQKKPSRATTNLLAKINGTQKRTLEECIACIAVCLKVHLRLKRRQTVKKFKPIVLAVIKLCYVVWSHQVDSRELVSQLVEKTILKKSVAAFWKYFRLIWKGA